MPGLTSFGCVRCGRSCGGAVAIENDDLSRVVCGDCYKVASPAERQEIPERSNLVKDTSSLESAQRKYTPHRKEKGEVSPQGASANIKESGTRGLIDFFGEAGLNVKITNQGHRLVVNGVVVYLGSRPVQEIPGPETQEWRQEIDAIAWRGASAKLGDAIRVQGSVAGYKLVEVPDESGFAVMFGDEAVALIRATEARVRGGVRVRGNFLTGGAHWDRMGMAVRSAVRGSNKPERQIPMPFDARATSQIQLVDSRAEWQREQEAILQQQREAWERQQRQKEQRQRMGQANSWAGATAEQEAPVATQDPRIQGIAEKPTVKSLPPGWEHLLQFFRAAGIGASIVRADQSVLLNGKEVRNVFAGLGDLRPGTPAWRDAVDQLAWEHARDVLRQALKQNVRLSADVRVQAVADEKGFAVVRGAEELALIRASRCMRPGHGPLIGNFLTSGSHWDQLARYLYSIGACTMPARTPGLLTRRIDALPHGLPRGLLDACTGASRRIRTDRRIAFERPVTLECNRGELAVQPITGYAPELRVPFTYRRNQSLAAGVIRGELHLSRHDPMPVTVGEDVRDEDAYKAWIAMLLGFADLTCNGPEPANPHRLDEHPTTTSSELHRLRHLSPGRVTIPRERIGPLQLIGKWIDLGGSYVAAHVRRLRDDQEHSAEAEDRAAQAGIILQPHETWVREHVRGVPEGTEIRFRWTPPKELNSYL